MSEELMTVSAALPEIIDPPSDVQAKLSAPDREVSTPMGTVKLTDGQRALLLARATEAQVELKPTGEIYMPGVFYRTMLQMVFGPGGWHDEKGTPVMNVQEDAYKSTLYLKVRLVVGRCTRCYRTTQACQCGGPYDAVCLAEDIGAQAYHPKNARLSYDDAFTAAVTNGLMRCCSKTLGVYANCWEPRWADEARWQVGVKVQARDWNNKVKVQWRRWDRRPLDGEFALAADSPNADKVRKPSVAPPPPVTVMQVKPTPAASKPPAPVAAPKAERIGVIRPDQSGETEAWVVTTDIGTHWTDDGHIVRHLEQLKARGKLVVFEDELLTGAKGATRKRIVNYKAVDAVK